MKKEMVVLMIGTFVLMAALALAYPTPYHIDLEQSIESYPDSPGPGPSSGISSWIEVLGGIGVFVAVCYVAITSLVKEIKRGFKPNLGIDLSQFSSSKVEQLQLQVMMRSVSTALSDGAWKFFGYSSRPKHGSIIQLFRPKWKVGIERKLFRELAISHIAAHIVVGIISIEDVKQVIEAVVDDCLYGHDNLVSLGYTSQKEAKTGMQTSIQKYAKTPVDSWDKVFMSHICLASLPKNKTTVGIVAGCVKFSQLSNFIIHQLKNQ